MEGEGLWNVTLRLSITQTFINARDPLVQQQLTVAPGTSVTTGVHLLFSN